MEYKIVYAPSPEGLVSKVNEEIKNGWKPIGGHQVSEQHRQNRYSGQQHMDTIIKQEYSQSLIKE
jgi:hypothetical protein